MKKMTALLLAMAMMLGVIACGSGGGETKATEAATAAKTEAAAAETEAPATEDVEREEVTIEVWIAQVDWADAWDEMEERFEEQYPWIQVDHVGLGEDATFMATRMAANDLPDVIQISRTAEMDKMVAENMLEDLTNYPCAAYMSQAYKDSYTYDGKLYGMCQGAAFACFFYNMEILKEAGWETIPTNWDELLQCCADIDEKTDAAPLVTAAGKHTTAFMPVEMILANIMNDADKAAAYQEDFMNGTFDWKAYPELITRLDAIAPYFLTGTATALEEDAAAYMADGSAAMCLAGNWNGGILIDAIASLSGEENVAAAVPAFGDGQTTWISASPETGFSVTVNPNRTEAEQEAVETFFNWVFEAENFQLIQNARGTVPVITNMTGDQIVLPDAMGPVVEEMGKAPFVLFGFNLYAAEFRDAAVAAIGGLFSGDIDATAVIDKFAEMLPKSFKAQ